MLVLGLGAWAGGIGWLATEGSGRWVIILGWGCALTTSVALQIRQRGVDHPVARTVFAALIVGGAVAGSAGTRSHAWESGPVGELGRERAVGEAVVRLTSDPRLLRGRFDESVIVRARTIRVSGRGEARAAAAPVLVIADRRWLTLALGATVHTSGRFGPSDDSDVAAVVSARGRPRVIRGPPTVFAGADRIREALRVSVTGRPADQAALVPALVVGDDARVSESLATDFRTTGLTHLMAVSGTNLTLMVGFLLLLARWAGVRGRGLTVVAVVGILGFVLVARAEPSVLRAAVMGGVALIGLGGGRRRGTRALGVAMTVLLLAQPWLALSAGFALSVLATAGILLLAPAWRTAFARWLPSPIADAVAVPLAAQLACTPVVAAISGEVSLVAVVANLVAAPAVAPATVLGFAGGLCGLVWPTLATLCGWGAGWCVAWIALVARVGADLPTAAIAWPGDRWGIGLLSGLSALVAVLGPRLVARRWIGLLVAVALVLAVVLRPPTPGWPPKGWVLAACDVGQGDA